MVKKSLRNFPKVSLDAISKCLESGGKKNTGEKNYRFFREGYVFDVYTWTSAAGESLMKARCCRLLRKNEEPHYLVVKMKNGDQAVVAQAHCNNLSRDEVTALRRLKKTSALNLKKEDKGTTTVIMNKTETKVTNEQLCDWKIGSYKAKLVLSRLVMIRRVTATD